MESARPLFPIQPLQPLQPLQPFSPVAAARPSSIPYGSLRSQLLLQPERPRTRFGHCSATANALLLTSHSLPQRRIRRRCPAGVSVRRSGGEKSPEVPFRAEAGTSAPDASPAPCRRACLQGTLGQSLACFVPLSAAASTPHLRRDKWCSAESGARAGGDVERRKF